MLLVISLGAALCGGIIKKQYATEYPDSTVYIYLCNMVSSLVAALTLLLWGGLGGISAFTVILGIVFGLVTALSAYAGMKAIKYGPWSYTSVVCAFSTLIPAFSGVLIWKEDFHLAYLLGILLMCVCFVLSTDLKGDRKEMSRKWLMYCIISFLATGTIGVMQKCHQNTVHKGELNAFIIISMLVACLYAFLWTMAADRRERKEAFRVLRSPRWLALLSLSGICVAVNNKLNLYLSGTMDSAVFFPIVNGGGLVLTVLASAVIFKERPTRRQWIGIIVGIAAVLIICNPVF